MPAKKLRYCKRCHCELFNRLRALYCELCSQIHTQETTIKHHQKLLAALKEKELMAAGYKT